MLMCADIKCEDGKIMVRSATWVCLLTISLVLSGIAATALRNAIYVDTNVPGAGQTNLAGKPEYAKVIEEHKK